MSQLAKLWVSDQTRGGDKSRSESTRQRAEPQAGVPYSTAGKSVVWDEGRRLLVSKDTEGKSMTIESRQAEVRRPLMAVKPMTQQGQWVCFGLARAFAYKTDTGRAIPFESTPNGWNLTVELGAPKRRNSVCNRRKSRTHEEDRVTQSNTCSLDEGMRLLYTFFGWQGTDL